MSNCVVCGRGPKFYENIEIENKALKRLIRKVMADKNGQWTAPLFMDHSGNLDIGLKKQIFGNKGNG